MSRIVFLLTRFSVEHFFELFIFCRVIFVGVRQYAVTSCQCDRGKVAGIYPLALDRITSTVESSAQTGNRIEAHPRNILD